MSDFYQRPGDLADPVGTRYLSFDSHADWRRPPQLTPAQLAGMQRLQGILDDLGGISADALAAALVKVLASDQGQAVVDKLASVGANAAAKAAKEQVIKLTFPMVLVGILVGYGMGSRTAKRRALPPAERNPWRLR